MKFNLNLYLVSETLIFKTLNNLNKTSHRPYEGINAILIQLGENPLESEQFYNVCSRKYFSFETLTSQVVWSFILNFDSLTWLEGKILSLLMRSILHAPVLFCTMQGCLYPALGLQHSMVVK